MADNAQKTPLGTYLDMKVAHDIASAMRNRSGRLPATLYQQKQGDQTNTVWMVNFETDGTYTLPMVALPVHTNEYTRPPYKQGDKGFVSTADVDTTSMSGLNDNSSPANFGRPANLAALVWHPLGNTQFPAVIDPTAHETYGGPGGTVTHDGTKKSLVKTHATNGSSVSSNGDGTGNVGTEAHTTHPTQGTATTSKVASQIQAPNAQLDNAGNLHNTGTTTSNGAITSAASVSAPSGNFASGSIGGMSLSGGVLGALSSTLQMVMGNSGSGGSTPSSMTADQGSFGSMTVGQGAFGTVMAKKYAQLPSYTVAQLFAALPPTSTPAGARVYVTDFGNTTPTFTGIVGSTSGGGTTPMPLYCDGTNWRAG